MTDSILRRNPGKRGRKRRREGVERLGYPHLRIICSYNDPDQEKKKRKEEYGTLRIRQRQ